MFDELGLNTARQPDNGANPRPDNRAGWLDGAPPDEQVIVRGAPGDDAELALDIRLWDPSTQLRFKRKTSVPPRPDGAPNRAPARTGTG